ncbi:DNA helicase [Lactobacillus phage Lpa804]|uniref:DNA helicase n=1 Tax=Lactobacillus phage Lpa804 TaxID=2059850 RepID=A0A3Q8C6K8_9CAUD|nr:DNA helicase [Lactobacillus phage Lpa804]AUG84723.1 DNA helicase [Lactobacillus phage Lpa804]
MKITIGNSYAKIYFDTETDRFIKYIKDRIHEELDPLDPNRFRKASFRKYHTWDGRVNLCDLDNNLVPTGLVSDLLLLLQREQNKNAYIKYSLEDVRGIKIAPSKSLPEEVVMQGEGVRKVTIRDYQLEAIKSVYANQTGIVLAATNAGKTLISITSIAKVLPELDSTDNVLFIAPNTSIMNQVHKNMEGYLGVPVGLWGDGNRDLKQVTCATIQTLNKALKNPEDAVKLTSAKDKLLKRMATVYAKDILDSVNPRQSLKGYAKNFKPKYKYEIDDKQELASLAVSLDSDKAVIKYFENFKKRYNKLISKKNAKGFDKYNVAVEYLSHVKIVMVDECQHASSDSYQETFKFLPNARLRIGLTGTLDKGKKVEMAKIKSVLGDIIYDIDNHQMIEQGVSARPHIKLVDFNKPVDLEKQVNRSIPKGTPSNQESLVKYQLTYQIGITNNEDRNKLIAELGSKLSSLDNGAVLIVVNSIEHGENIAEYLGKTDTEYAFIQGKNTTEERTDILNRVRSGELKVLIGTKVMDEGIDIPNIRYMIYASAGKSFVQTLQRIGRLLRISADKHEVYIFDIIDRNAEYLFNQAKQRVKYYKDQKFEVK